MWPWEVVGLLEEPEAARRLALEAHSRGDGDANRRGLDRSSFMRLSRRRDSKRTLRSRAHSSSKSWSSSRGWALGWLNGRWPAMVAVVVERRA